MDQGFSNTTWHNPTEHDVKFSIFVGPGIKHKVAISAGKELALPSEYDNDIRTVRQGVVVGGLAPQLTIKGHEKLPMHESLAKAADLGDDERKVVAGTGRSAGGMSLDVATALMAQNDELRKRLAQLEAALGVAQAPTEKPADKAADPVKAPPAAEQTGDKTAVKGR